MFQHGQQPSAAFLAGGALQHDNAARSMALRLYRRSRMRGWARRLWARIAGRPRDLSRMSGVSARRQRASGSSTVLLAAIRGSEGRSGDFDPHFSPRQGHSRDRWVSVAMARLQGVALPAITLVQTDEGYYVRDGHHRVSVARALGERYIDAEIV